MIKLIKLIVYKKTSEIKVNFQYIILKFFFSFDFLILKQINVI